MNVFQSIGRVANRYLDALSEAPEGFSPSYGRFYVLGQFGYPMGLAGYLGFLLMFLWLGLTVMAAVNAFASLVVAWAFWRHSKGHIHLPACVVLLVLIPLHTVVATVYFGAFTAYWVQNYVTISVILLIPTLPRPTRVYLGGLYSLFAIGVCSISLFIPPLTPVSPVTEIVFIGANIMAFAVLVLSIITSFDVAVVRAEKAQAIEYARAESLLLNILPLEIANRLKAHEEPLADAHDNVSVLFADLAGFTELSRQLSANELVTMLNDLFSRFDELLARHGAEKIKTIGDAYMVATGLHGNASDHAEKIADLALGMRAAFMAFRRDNHVKLQLRIGVHSGAVVAGVIGHQKFAYDLWGDTVNIASRMESEGLPDQIQISSQTHAMLPGRFKVAPRGEIEIKGHRNRSTYLLAGLA